MIIYDDDSALVYSNFHIKKPSKWKADELYNFINFYEAFGVEFIGKV